MQICLVSSLNLSSWFSQESEPVMTALPLGILSLAAVIENSPHAVTVIDFNEEIMAGEIALDETLYRACATRIARSSPDIVGFSTMCNAYHLALRMAQAVKEILPGAVILFGGPQASVTDLKTLQSFPAVDMILRGEAEESLRLLLDALSGGLSLNPIPGLTFRKQGQIIRNPPIRNFVDLERIPPPAYHRYPYPLPATLAVDVGRGCPFACSFCSTSTFWRRRFRLKSIPRILEEIHRLKKDYGTTDFSFMHDLFTVNRRRLMAFCDALIAADLQITWSCSARLDCVDEALLNRMAASGCQTIFYGVETGSPRMQNEINKHLDLNRAAAIVAATLEQGINPTLSFIAGFPTESLADLQQTLEMIEHFLHHPLVSIQLHLLAPQVNTPDFEHYQARLAYDGYFSDIACSDDRFLERAWFQAYPTLFSSFYYYQNNRLPRAVLQGLDIFIHGLCAQMRGTVLHLLRGRPGLWELYQDWRRWTGGAVPGRAQVHGTGLDEKGLDGYLLDFYRFAEEKVRSGQAAFDLGDSRDEIIAFYLRHYGQSPIRFVEPVSEGLEREGRP